MSVHYFDHAASAPRSSRVADAMAPFERGVVGNPSGAHRAARVARRALEDARDSVADHLGLPATGVVFTGGGTESCTLALAGVMVRHRTSSRRGLVVSSIEHHAVLDAADLCQREYGADLTHLGVTPRGVIDLNHVDRAVSDTTALVSVMTVNNETGVLQPIGEVAERAHEHGALLHTDAVAAAPWVDLREYVASADLISLAAHKLGGPVNSGLLAVRPGVDILAPSPGGGQERGWRGGTVDVAAAVGLAAALEETVERRVATLAHAARLRDRLWAGVADLDGVHRTADVDTAVPGTLHLCVADVASDELLFLLDQAGVCASAGAACSSGAAQSSHVLAAMGVANDLARGALRLSWGAETTDADVDAAIRALRDAHHRLRGGEVLAD